VANPTQTDAPFDADARRAVASVATQFFINGAVFASFIPRLPEIRDRIGVSTDVLGALLTTGAVVGLLGSFIASRVIERFGTRRVLIAGAMVLIATLPVIGFATAPVIFVLGLGLMAAFDVVVDVAMNLQGSWLSARRHAPIMNRLHGLWSLGTVVGGLAAAQITSVGISLQSHLLGVALLLGCALVFVGRGLLRVDEDQVDPVDSDLDEPRASPRTAQPSGRRGLIMLALAGGFAIAVELVSSDWAAFRLSDDFATNAGFAGLGYVAFTVGMTIGRFGGDWALAKIGANALNRAAVAVTAIGLAGAALLPNRYLVLVSYVFAGLGISTFFPRLYDKAAQLPGKRGAGLGALTAGSRVTALATPVIVGSLAATSLSVGTATAIVVIPSVLAFAAVTLAVD